MTARWNDVIPPVVLARRWRGRHRPGSGRWRPTGEELERRWREYLEAREGCR